MLQRTALSVLLALTALLPSRVAVAQAVPAPQNAPKPDPSTLHVFVNLVQIPVLILDRQFQNLPRIPDRNFRVLLQGYGKLTPAHIRLEGEDPINLVLLVDRSDRDETLWNSLPDSLGPMIAALLPHDRLSVVVMDGCKATRMGSEMVPFNAEWLKQMARNTTEIKSYSQAGRHRDPCPRPVRYWDIVLYAASRLSEYPGRKIIVSLGNGDIVDSTESARVHAVLNAHSITLFPIVHAGTAFNGGVLPFGTRDLRSGIQARDMAMVNPGLNFEAVVALLEHSERSGGMVLGTTVRSFAKTLGRPIELARGRYILEFPRPDTLPPGQHFLIVTDGHPHDFIRPAGITVPLATAAEKNATVADHRAPGQGTAPNASSPAASSPAAASPPAQANEAHSQPDSSSPATPVHASAAQSDTPPSPPAAAPPNAATPPESAGPTNVTDQLQPSH